MLAVLLALQLAGLEPPLPSDPRIRNQLYNPNQVTELNVDQGYAAIVELGSDEKVDSVVVGNSADWQVTTTERGDVVVVKPLGGTSTNMIITTGDRRYVFLLGSGGSGGGSFVLRFVYPAPPGTATAMTPAGTPPAPTAKSYRFHGAKELIPLAMSDDGHRTTIRWNKDVSLPAVFARDRQGRETLVNGRMEGGDYVLEGVADSYVFRAGDRQAQAKRVVRKP